uniref:DUF19 domain-containing protein n=1 Tax=Strigamia maritima TaxID=126957 RepID=T1J1N2_STRMM
MASISTHTLFIPIFLSLVAISQARILNRDKPDPDLMFCANLAINLQQCLALNDFPFCNGTKSLLQQCTDGYLSDLSKCKVSIIKEVLKYRLDIYSLSDQVLCKDHLYRKFVNDVGCWRLAKAELGSLSGLVQGLLTKDGCKVAKINVDVIIGFGYNYPGCPAKLETYLKPIFKKTACAGS